MADAEEQDRRDRRGVLSWMRWVGQHELVTLVVLLVVAAGVWGFFELADAALADQTIPIDESLLLAMRSSEDPSVLVGPAWLGELGRDFTSLGSSGVLAVLTLAAAGFLALQRKTHAMLFLLLAVGSGMVLTILLKEGFDRPRPDLVPHAAGVHTASFPSGHSMMAAVVYLTLGALLARVQSQWTVKAYLLTLAVLLTLVVGVSRVYLGVHWPTDVLAGWTAGACWALLCWMAARWLQRRGRVESDRAEN